MRIVMPVLLWIAAIISCAVSGKQIETVQVVTRLQSKSDAKLTHYGPADKASFIKVENRQECSELTTYTGDVVESTRRFNSRSLNALEVVSLNNDFEDAFLVARDLRKSYSYTNQLSKPRIIQILKSGRAVERQFESGEPIAVAVNGKDIALLFFSISIESDLGHGLVGTTSYLLSTSTLDPATAISKPVEIENSSNWEHLGVWTRTNNESSYPVFLFSEIIDNSDANVIAVDISSGEIHIERQKVRAQLHAFGKNNMVLREGPLNHVQVFDLGNLKSLEELSMIAHFAIDLGDRRLVDIARSKYKEWCLLIEDPTRHIQTLEIANGEGSMRTMHEGLVPFANSIFVSDKTVFVW